jgi:quercetin dioxygenase-like cupin family protein
VDEPIVLLPGEGEILADTESRWSRIKVARDECLLAESSYRSGERGAAPHIHREHADAFYVLDGELVFRVASERRSLSAGSFVLAPPGLVHGFEVGPRGVRHLNLHVPGKAFAQLSRARRDGIPFAAADGDTFDPPADGGLPASEAAVLGPGEGEQVGGSVVKAARTELSLLEGVVDPGEEVKAHLHRAHSDSFYVLEGELEFLIGGRDVPAGAGSFVLSPPGVVHGFRNSSRGSARILNLHAPGGFVEYRRELAELRGRGETPDQSFYERHDVFAF